MATKKGNTISTKAAETKAEPKQVTVSSILNAEAESYYREEGCCY